MFILHDTNGAPTNDAAALILNRRSPHQTLWASESDDAQRDRLVVFLKCQTFYDQHSLYDAKLQYELSLRPSLEVRMQARAKERQMHRKACDPQAQARIVAVLEATAAGQRQIK